MGREGGQVIVSSRVPKVVRKVDGVGRTRLVKIRKKSVGDVPVEKTPLWGLGVVSTSEDEVRRPECEGPSRIVRRTINKQKGCDKVLMTR